MQHSIELLDKALKVQKAAHWAEALGINRATLSIAKTKGRLSPTLAGAIAAELGENVMQWVAIAAMEAEPETPLARKIRNLASH